jgi:hypothetical protein
VKRGARRWEALGGNVNTPALALHYMSKTTKILDAVDDKVEDGDAKEFRSGYVVFLLSTPQEGQFTLAYLRHCSILVYEERGIPDANTESLYSPTHSSSLSNPPAEEGPPSYLPSFLPSPPAAMKGTHRNKA